MLQVFFLLFQGQFATFHRGNVAYGQQNRRHSLPFNRAVRALQPDVATVADRQGYFKTVFQHAFFELPQRGFEAFSGVFTDEVG